MKCPVCTEEIHYFANEVSCGKCGYEDEFRDYQIRKLESEVARLREALGEIAEYGEYGNTGEDAQVMWGIAKEALKANPN